MALLRTEIDLALHQGESREELREALRNAFSEAERLSRVAASLLLSRAPIAVGSPSSASRSTSSSRSTACSAAVRRRVPQPRRASEGRSGAMRPVRRRARPRPGPDRSGPGTQTLGNHLPKLRRRRERVASAAASRRAARRRPPHRRGRRARGAEAGRAR
ncbi:MAG: hypothetical protein HZB46_03690 [Solirubrobacterales bacterium]|nr:hypothetical protein [Solirubrobacterales bacterium]